MWPVPTKRRRISRRWSTSCATPEVPRDRRADSPGGVARRPARYRQTLLGRAVAGEAGVPFFSISGSEFVEMFVGVGASRVRDLFVQAKTAEPSIVFVDELDAVGRRRGAGVGATNDEREQTFNQLLVEMDGFDDRQQVILLAATNRPDVLDPALLRPGRFDRQVVVPLPDWRGREGILRIHTRHLHVATDVDLERLARTTTGLSGADLANLCNEAALGTARHDRTEVTMEDFEQAWDKIVLGAERTTVLTPHDRRVVAYHESGHARGGVADARSRSGAKSHDRAARSRTRRYGTTAGGGAVQLQPNRSLARIDVMLGGRESEALAMGDITTGAENDLVRATRLVRRMITRWGMGSLGPVAFQTDEEQPFLGYQLAQGRDYSDATAARIDQEVEHLIAERHEVVRQLLSAARRNSMRCGGLAERCTHSARTRLDAFLDRARRLRSNCRLRRRPILWSPRRVFTRLTCRNTPVEDRLSGREEEMGRGLNPGRLPEATTAGSG